MENFSHFSSAEAELRSDNFKFLGRISAPVQSHLKQVYVDLCFGLIASAVGAWVHLLWNVGGILTSTASVGCIIWLLSLPSYEEKKRIGFFIAAALLEGASVGPLIRLAVQIDASILVVAFVGSALAFVCFSAAALLTERREYLYLYGLVSSGLSIRLWLQLASFIFGGSAALFKLELYFGLLVFIGYIVVDTQEIIERAYHGDMDHIKHSLFLFTDFFAIFVRILIIMLNNSNEKERKKRRD